MKREKELRRPVARFIVLTNLIFWPLFLLVGAAFLAGMPPVVIDLMLCVASWSSTLAFFILFRRIYPGQSFLAFVKDRFKTRLKGSVVAAVVGIQILIFIVVILILAKQDGVSPIFTFFSAGMLVYVFFKSLFAGPLGEELGWRGFAQNELQKKHSPLTASLIVGFWWGLWHLPIWFTTGYTGGQLLAYMGCFMVAIMSISIIIAAFYHHTFTNAPERDVQ